MSFMTPTTPAMFTLDINAKNGTPFRVLAIAASAEGPNRFRAPADREHPTVEFYDRRYPIDGEHGQFTGGCYRIDTILGRDGYSSGNGGVALYGGEPAWTVDAVSMDFVRPWLAALVDGGHLA